MKILRNASLPSLRSILSRTSTVLLPFASGIFLAISLRLFLSVIVKRHAVDVSFPPFTVSSSQCPKFSRSSTSFGRLSMLCSAHFARLKFFLEPFSLYFSPLLGKSVLETPGISPPFTQLYNVFSTARHAFRLVSPLYSVLRALRMGCTSRQRCSALVSVPEPCRA